jgi:methyl-accepting chemotaxis protein
MSNRESLWKRFNDTSLVRIISTKIRNKLVFTLLFVSLGPLATLGMVLYRSSDKALMEQAVSQLAAVRTIKANQVEQYFQTIRDQMATFAENRMTIEAMREFAPAFTAARTENGIDNEKLEQLRKELYTYYTGDFSTEYVRRNPGTTPSVREPFSILDDDSLYLQSLYVKSNPNPLGSKHLLDRSEDPSRYSQLHGKYHPIIRSFLQKFGYYDIFLCDLASGDVVYTVFKELDFTTSLIDGPYAQSNIGKAFRLAAAAESPDEVFLVDYEPYVPSYRDAASFIAAPIFDEGQKIGVAIFQIPIDRVNAIMAERTGLGRTGETYAVGEDKLFRNESRFLKDLGVKSTIINPKVPVDTEASRAALTGDSGTRIIADYRGTPVLSSWTPINVFAGVTGSADPIRWALMSEIDLEEVREPVTAAGVLRDTWTVVGISAILVVGAAVFLARGIVRQTNSITDMLSNIGIGDFGARAEVYNEDELGSVAHSLNAMCDNTLSLIQSREERDQIQESVELLQREMDSVARGDLTVTAQERADITGPIASAINNMTRQLRQIVTNVKATTLQVSTSAHQILTTTEHLSKGSDAQSTQITSTSAAVDEMATSVQQVAENTAQSAEIAEQARQNAAKGSTAVAAMVTGMERIRNQVQETSKRIKRLGESSQEVGEIVQLISDIADRTSILALNASIQAAMAGDAGQGFAVVAEEVERLAERANDATKQIATLIKGIQTETAEATADMEESTKEVVEGSRLATQAGQTLHDIDTVSHRLAELIGSISMATKQQARGAAAVSQSMSEISTVTQQAASGTKQAAESVKHLAQLAYELRNSVSRFKLPEAPTTEEPPRERTRPTMPGVVFADAGSTIEFPVAFTS